MSTSSNVDQGEAELQRIYVLCVDIFRGGLAAVLAGTLFLGVGGRLIMRASALLNPDATGTITDNENVVGDITAAGSLELLIFGGITGGLVAGTIWVLVREWLPQDMGTRCIIAALLAASASTLIVDADNDDFRLLDPLAFHVAAFVALMAVTGGTTAALDRLLEGRLPTSPTASAILGSLAATGLVLAMPQLIFGVLIGELASLPATISLLAVAVATTAAWTAYYSHGDEALLNRPNWQRRLGVSAVCIFGLAGFITSRSKSRHSPEETLGYSSSCPRRNAVTRCHARGSSRVNP